jgi:hypothetical protein
MRFSEIDIFGVFVSPMAPILIGGWLILLVLRRIADRTGLWRRVWHPALASLSVYVMIMSAILVGAAAWGGGR